MLKQYLQLKLSQKLSPQQIQLMKLIQLPTQAFEQRLKQELEENPALESGKEVDEYEDTYDDYDSNETDYEDHETIGNDDINVDEYLSDDEIPEYRTQTNNYSSDDEDRDIPYAAGTSFNQYLLGQLNTFRLNDEEREIAEFLVGSIDESGYIRREIPVFMDNLSFTQNVFTSEEQIEKVLKIVHDLDPAGVGARNLQECLSIQLHRKEKTPDVELAIDIID
ncbi:MAG: RNA polymerase sigma-54 factor, partial [Mangrovimonas sp.]|nr:RNA polymerase sigma-54 factor [Mangrovimonas sp.]